MASFTGIQIITIHLWPNISRSRNNQTIKCVELREYNMRSIIKINHEWLWGNLSRPFYKKIKIEHISGSII